MWALCSQRVFIVIVFRFVREGTSTSIVYIIFLTCKRRFDIWVLVCLNVSRTIIWWIKLFVRPFADGSSVKLAEACRRYLINPGKMFNCTVSASVQYCCKLLQSTSLKDKINNFLFFKLLSSSSIAPIPEDLWILFSFY